MRSGSGGCSQLPTSQCSAVITCRVDALLVEKVWQCLRRKHSRIDQVSIAANIKKKRKRCRISYSFRGYVHSLVLLKAEKFRDGNPYLD